MFVNTLTRTCDTCLKTCENATITQRDQFTNLHQHRKGLTVNICRNKNVVYHSTLLLAEPAFAAESVNKSFLFRVVFKIALLKSHFTVPVLTRYLSVKDSRYTGMILNMFAFTQSCVSPGFMEHLTTSGTVCGIELEHQGSIRIIPNSPYHRGCFPVLLIFHFGRTWAPLRH